MSRILPVTILLSFLFAASTVSAQPACDTEALCKTCVSGLPDGYNFLKNYKVDGLAGQKTKVEYSYVFTKGTSYVVNLCTPGSTPDGMVVTYFDASRKELGSSKVAGQFLRELRFECGATGIYYIQYTFEGSKSFCGGSAIGFKR